MGDARLPKPVQFHTHEMTPAALRALAESMGYADVVTVTTTSLRTAQAAILAKAVASRPADFGTEARSN